MIGDISNIADTQFKVCLIKNFIDFICLDIGRQVQNLYQLIVQVGTIIQTIP